MQGQIRIYAYNARIKKHIWKSNQKCKRKVKKSFLLMFIVVLKYHVPKYLTVSVKFNYNFRFDFIDKLGFVSLLA